MVRVRALAPVLQVDALSIARSQPRCTWAGSLSRPCRVRNSRQELQRPRRGAGCHPQTMHAVTAPSVDRKSGTKSGTIPTPWTGVSGKPAGRSVGAEGLEPPTFAL